MKVSATFAARIAPYVSAELDAAWALVREGNPAQAFAKLERAHVLGQASTVQHVRVHCHMLAWAWQLRSTAEFRGQLLRILGAATKTFLGWIPSGNTGGTNISPFQRLPIADELASIISQSKRRSDNE
jgi:Protein of unknown function (DUF3703)